MTFSVRKEEDGFRVISTDKNGEEWDVDGPFETQQEVDASLAFHQSEWDSSHPDDEK